MNKAGERERFTVLDGMRGVAALVVITDHVPSLTLMSLLPGRYLAVDFFFALSGFVLAHAYGARLAAGGMGVGGFMRARLIRLYPLYLFATLAGVALLVGSLLKGWIEAPGSHVAATIGFGLAMAPTPPNLTLFQNLPFPMNGPAWSLFFELVANLVFAVLAVRLTPRLLAGLLAVSGALLVVTAFTFGKLDSGFLWSNFFGGFPRVFYAFFAGVAIYRLRAVWTAPALPPWLGVAALLAVFAVPAVGVWRPIFDLCAALALFPLLIAFTANARTSGRMGQVYASMGLYSYGIYVLQVPVKDWLDLILPKLIPAHMHLPGFAHVLIVAAATIATAALLHWIYDAPVRRFLSRIGTRAPAAAVAQTTPTPN